MLTLDNYDENERMMRSHLKLVHGIYIEPSLAMEGKDGIVDCHNQAHADGLAGTDGWTRLAFRHQHVSRETLGADVEEWVW